MVIKFCIFIFSLDNKEKQSSKEESLIASLKTLVRVDGPHGAPAEHFNNYEHVMFVAGGVGATPFSSILIGLLYKLKKGEPITHKSITFFWIQREYEKFDYLNNILEEIAVEDKDRLFEIDVFVTSAQQKYDFR
jgi:predicted ferric reductase